MIPSFAKVVVYMKTCVLAYTLQVAKAFQPPDLSGPEGRSAALKAVNMRHLAWLKRSSTTGPVAWRPKKVHRVSTVKWLLCKDNMIRVGTQWDGLHSFCRNPTGPFWATKAWRRWPHLTLCQDQGGDGLSGVLCLKYLKKLRGNVTEWWDQSHGIGNDLLATWKSHALFSYIMVTMVVMNLAHGPEKEPDMRFAQMSECLKFLVDNFTPDTLGSIHRHADTILSELNGKVLVEDGKPIDALWAYICDLAGFPKQGRRVNMCRFLAWVRGAKFLLQHWTLLLWMLEHLCIEMDMLGGTKLRSLAVKDQDASQIEEQTTTSTAVPSLESKALRSCCQNAAVVAVMILGDYSNRRLMACMVWSAESLDRFHGKQNAGCRSVQENMKHTLDMVQGGFTDSLVAVWKQLLNRDALLDTNLLPRDGYCMKYTFDGDLVIQEEDEWAALFGSFCHSHVANRSIRELYRFGYPHTFVLMVKGAKLPLDYIKQLREDYGIFQALQAQPHKTSAEEQVLSRSQFQCTAVLQVVAALEEFRWVIDDEVNALLTERFSCFVGSQLSEDLFGCAKNCKQVRGSQRFRKPERSMGICLGEEIPSKRHRYELVGSLVALPRKSARLAAGAFGKVQVDHEIDLKGVASTSQKPDYFSTTARQSGVPVSDLSLMRHCAKHVKRHDLEQAYLGCFAGPHCFVFKSDADALVSGHAPFPWHIGMGHMRDSAAIAWPVSVLPVPGHPDVFYVDFIKPAKPFPSMLPIVNWHFIKACPFTWHSPLYLSCTYTNSPPWWRSQVQAIVGGCVVSPLKVVIARHGWLDLGGDILKRIALHLNVSVPAKASVWETMLAMTMEVLSVDEEVATGILAKRVTRQRAGSACVEELLQMDEASKLLTRDDEEKLDKDKAKHKRMQAEEEEVFMEYKEARVRLRQAKAAQAKPGKGKKQKAQHVPVRRLPEMAVLDHAIAKRFSPPGSLLWRSFHGEAWCGRLPPRPSVTRGWRKYGGSNEALHAVLVEIWKQHCEDEGLAESECPVKGVFALPSASSGSAA